MGDVIIPTFGVGSSLRQRKTLAFRTELLSQTCSQLSSQLRRQQLELVPEKLHENFQEDSTSQRQRMLCLIPEISEFIPDLLSHVHKKIKYC